MNNQQDAKEIFLHTWPAITRECRQVLGSELHFQAMIYHCFRTYGKVPINQIAMNVKMWIDKPVSTLFKRKKKAKHPDFQQGFEPIPDIVLFKTSINSDWRRRNFENTTKKMLMAIEVKASENENKKIGPQSIINDILKLDALREEVREYNASLVPTVIIADTTPDPRERMRKESLERACDAAKDVGVGLFYVSRIGTVAIDWDGQILKPISDKLWIE
jgi:hypothetical protein